MGTTELAIRNEEMYLDISPTNAKKFLDTIRQFQIVVRSTLIEGHDYGIIPNTDKPTLLKPGAEKIVRLLRCRDKYEDMETVEDWDKPFFYYRVRCDFVLLGTDNVIITSGIGSANSNETKWKYRWVFDSDIPEGTDKQSLKKKQFNAKNGGKFYKYRVENDDIFDQVNTIQKIACKRALVMASLSAGSLSDLYTQDIEDMDFQNEEPPETEGHKNNVNKEKAKADLFEKIKGFKTLKELEKWASSQEANIKKSTAKAEIEAAIADKRKTFQTEPVMRDMAALELEVWQNKMDEFTEFDALVVWYEENQEAIHNSTQNQAIIEYLQKRQDFLKAQTDTETKDF